MQWRMGFARGLSLDARVKGGLWNFFQNPLEMKYPIDVEAFLQSTRQRIEVDSLTERFIRSYVPLVNSAYFDGRAGKAGYPMNPEHEARSWASKSGVELVDGADDVVLGIETEVIRRMNEAYNHGVQDAQSEVA